MNRYPRVEKIHVISDFSISVFRKTLINSLSEIVSELFVQSEESKSANGEPVGFFNEALHKNSYDF